MSARRTRSGLTSTASRRQQADVADGHNRVIDVFSEGRRALAQPRRNRAPQKSPSVCFAKLIDFKRERQKRYYLRHGRVRGLQVSDSELRDHARSARKWQKVLRSGSRVRSQMPRNSLIVRDWSSITVYPPQKVRFSISQLRSLLPSPPPSALEPR
jgi:hypothetical protein